MTTTPSNEGLYFILISIHGLIRGYDLELGRDADTGGQTKYVVELAKALGNRPEVAQVDLVTRLVEDERVSEAYAQPSEALSDTARIVRIPAGPAGYIPKEQLWDHMDEFADNLTAFIREQPLAPALIHSHYADAGYVGVRVANYLGLPLLHTGHSLGRDKRRRLRSAGLTGEEIERRFNMRRRIEAEEETLANASLVITSTNQEIEEQYGRYDYYDPSRMVVIPPGTDLTRFMTPDGSESQTPIHREITRFLAAPDKPMILALSRPDSRKNIPTLVSAYGESEPLQDLANLVLIAGNREDIRELDEGAQEVWTELLVLIDKYNLYGRVAYPKEHSANDVPLIYRIAAASRGVFINPALTEPFGLTLIEAAASGLPVVATDDGGPHEIIGHCQNGYLIDPLDREGIADKLLAVLNDSERWQTFAKNGVEGVASRFSWDAHAENYLGKVRPLLQLQKGPRVEVPAATVKHRDRALLVELDQLLAGDHETLHKLMRELREHRKRVSFGVVTDHNARTAFELLKKHRLGHPDVIISGQGTEIYYGRDLAADESWTDHIDHQWNPRRLRRILRRMPGVANRPQREQTPYRVASEVEPDTMPSVEEINQSLRQADETVSLSLYRHTKLDLTPTRATKGAAVRWFASVWDIPLERILVAGGTAADYDMLIGNILGAVLPNPYADELQSLNDSPRVYFTSEPGPGGILEAIKHFDFFGECVAPEPPAPEASSSTAEHDETAADD